MQFNGYQSIAELAEALNVSESWLDEELLEQLPDRQLTLYGESNYFATDLQRWFNERHCAIREEQRRMRMIGAEAYESKHVVFAKPQAPN